MNGIPSVLYKYRSINEFTFKILTHLEIYFANPKEFNDPFDCFIPIRYDQLTKEEHRERQMALIKRIKPNLNESEISKVVDEFVNSKKFRPHEQLGLINDSEIERVQNSIRVFCLSEENDNILMWSHYASLHTGICIGFDTDQLYKDTRAGIGRIVYSNEYPVIKPTPLGDMKDLIAQVATKSECWSYEKEYRFVYFENKPVFKISPSSIKELIFGVKTAKSDIDRILEILKSEDLAHVAVRQSERVKGQFKIQIH